MAYGLVCIFKNPLMSLEVTQNGESLLFVTVQKSSAHLKHYRKEIIILLKNKMTN